MTDTNPNRAVSGWSWLDRTLALADKLEQLVMNEAECFTASEIKTLTDQLAVAVLRWKQTLDAELARPYRSIRYVEPGMLSPLTASANSAAGYSAHGWHPND